MATTASPLPAPQQTQLTPVDLMLLAAANATNGQHPAITAGVASASQTVNDAVTGAQAAAQQQNVQGESEYLQQQSASVQQKYWDGLTATQQAAYRSVGYKPPAPHRSLWGDITHAAGTALHDVTNFSGAAHEALNALGAPLRAVQHGERTILDVANQAQTSTGSLAGEWGHWAADLNLLSKKSLSDWSRAWEETTNGQHYILPQVKQQVLQQYGTDTYNLALALAQGKTPADLLGNVSQQQQQTLQQQMQSPNTQKALQALNAGHITLGHMLLGPDTIARNPGWGNKISGIVDGVTDWFGDPLNVAGASVGEYSKTKYLVANGHSVQMLYDRMPQVRRAFQMMASAVANGDMNGAKGLLTQFPKLKQAAADMMGEHADTEQKVLDYFKRVADAQDVISGRPSNSLGEIVQSLPHVTRRGALRLQLKGETQKAIDWAAERIPTLRTEPGDLESGPNIADKLVYPAGRFARAATTLVPQHQFFRLTDPDAANVLNDIGLQFLDRQTVNKYLTDFVKDANTNNRVQVYRSMMLDAAHAAGLDTDPDFWDTHVGKFIAGLGQNYGEGDEMMVNGNLGHFGVGKRDLSTAVSIPDYRTWYLQARKGIVTQKLTNGINKDWIDKFMGFWRPLTLAHVGFALRVGGEEAFAFMLRNGPLAYLKASAARSYAKNLLRHQGELADKTGQDLTDAEAGMIWDRNTSHLKQSVKDSINTMQDMLKENVIDRVTRATGNMAGKLLPSQYRDAVEHGIQHGLLDPDGPFSHDLTAMHGYTPEGEDIQNYIKTRDGTKLVKANMREYKGYKPGEDMYMKMYYNQLHRAAGDDWKRAALLRGPQNGTKAQQYAVRVRRVADLLQSDPVWHSESLRALQDRSERQVASGQITERAAAEDHAKVLIHQVDKLTKRWVADDTERGGHYEEIPGLIDHMLKTGKPPSIAALAEIPETSLPDVWGPKTELVKVWRGNIRQATGKLFEKVIGPQINWLSREPMMWHEYAKARALYKPMSSKLRAAGVGEEAIEDLVHNNAWEQATKNTIGFVHNPNLRSQMSMVTRNLAPFWFAQEQFYKRWARTFAYAPDAFRKAQLLSQGLRHSGIVHTDPENGQQYFVYPGSGLVQQVLVDTLSHFGINAEVPVEAGLTGQVNMLNPAIQRVGAPNFGPLLVVPLNGLQTLDPHMSKAITAIEGNVAASSGFIKAIAPTTITRTLEVALPNAINASQYASAQMQAIQALEATGHGIGTPATNQVASTNIANPEPGDFVPISATSSLVYQPDGQWKTNSAATEQQYLQRIQNWARIFMFTRLVFGFAAPAAPEDQFNPGNLHNDLLTLMSEMPVDQAMTTFLAEHPNADAETVFQTQTPGGAFLPATKAAMSFLDKNPKLEQDYGDAATYFIPPADTQGNFNQDAYNEQMAKGWRQRKNPEQYYNQVMYQSAAQDYFAAQGYKDQLLAARAMPTAQLDNLWTQFSEQFMAANPVFASLYGSGQTGSTLPGTAGAGPLGRMQVMDDVGAAIHNGVAPQNSQTAALGVLYDSWVQWQTLTNTYGNPDQPTVSTNMKDQYDQQYAQYLANFEQQYPGTQPLIQRAIAPDLTYALDQLASQGIDVTL